MAVTFADPGGEYYFSLGINGSITAGVWTSQNSCSLVSTAPVGRAAASDGKFYAIFSNGGNVAKNLGVNYTHQVMHFAMYFTTPPLGVTLFQYKDIATVQTDLRVDGAGHLQIFGNGVQLGSNGPVVSAGWQFFELDVTFAITAIGAAQAWLNGVSAVTATSVRTAVTNAYSNGFSITLNNAGTYLKDVCILDATTGTNVAHLGDITVGVKFPNAAGTNQAWTPLSGTQVSNVQDGITHTGTWPDGDTTYISSATAGQISDFAHETLASIGAGTLYCVIHVTYARKDDVGSRAFRQVCLSGATTETNGVDISATNTYLYYFDPLDQNPNGPATWTVTTYNAATFGVKEIT
jgi:hypothetical protein